MNFENINNKLGTSIREIIEKKDFNKSYQKDNELKFQINILFTLFSINSTKNNARFIYQGVEDLALIGKEHLAFKYHQKYLDNKVYEHINKQNLENY